MARRIDKKDTDADIALKELFGAQKSFVVVAGAGSGKTTSLVKALDYLSNVNGPILKRNKQKIACITYTTGAVEEISADVNHDQLFHVSTIHSFLWVLIQPFQSDIKKWVTRRINEKIEELKTEAAGFSSRVQQRTIDKNTEDQKRLTEQLDLISEVARFDYDTASDFPKGLIGHSDVIKLSCTLIKEKPILRKIISNRFPFVFVDESQDTLPELVEVLKLIDSEYPTSISIGFFGDPMQKIYLTGVGDVDLEKDWVKVEKPENYRCPTEVLHVINKLRLGVDKFQQTGGRKDYSAEMPVEVVGSAHLFILPADQYRSTYIDQIKKFLAKKLDDDQWVATDTNKENPPIKMLMIEHRMAANRLEFADLFAAFKDSGSESQSAAFTEGNAWPLRPFMDFVMPLIEAIKANNQFKIIELLRFHSPILTTEYLAEKKGGASTVFADLKKEVNALSQLFEPGSTAKISDVTSFIRDKNLCLLEDRFVSLLDGKIPASGEEEKETTKTVFDSMMGCNATSLIGYRTYLNEESPYSTQHSVKGAEFDRVMVILDDEEGRRSTLYSYEKLFGVKALSTRDEENLRDGKDSVLDRTRRLLYVCCSRAMKDLAVVFFVQNVDQAFDTIEKAGTFNADCVLRLKDIAN